MATKHSYKIGEVRAVVATFVAANHWNPADTYDVRAHTRLTLFKAPALEDNYNNHYVVDPSGKTDSKPGVAYNEAFIEPNVLTILQYVGDGMYGICLWRRVDEHQNP